MAVSDLFPLLRPHCPATEILPMLPPKWPPSGPQQKELASGLNLALRLRHLNLRQLPPFWPA